MELQMDRSVLGFSHEMKVFMLHIDLMIERSITEAEIAIWSLQLYIYIYIYVSLVKNGSKIP